MFIVMPWRMDVPQDRWPVMNWLIITALIGVYTLQVRDLAEYRTRQRVVAYDPQHRDHNSSHPQEQRRDLDRQDRREIPGITGELLLKGWALRGLLGYMWIHAGVLHLAGNLLFLWIFGNGLCAKLGNLKYLFLYVLCGVAAAAAHLLFDADPALGASGAINGVVGMYLVLFYENEITCLFVWLIPPYARFFDVSSIWMILFWLFWDIVSALRGAPEVAYFAHLGGFAIGFGIVLFMCWRNWITMERHEGSLLDAWRHRKTSGDEASLDAQCARVGLPAVNEVWAERLEVGAARSQVPRQRVDPNHEDFIRFACVCGKRIKVPTKYAGHSGTCPRCKVRLKVPPTST